MRSFVPLPRYDNESNLIERGLPRRGSVVRSPPPRRVERSRRKSSVFVAMEEDKYAEVLLPLTEGLDWDDDLAAMSPLDRFDHHHRK